MELYELSSDKGYQELNSDAKGVVFDKLSSKNEGYSRLSEDAKTIVRNKIVGISPTEKKYNAADIPEQGADTPTPQTAPYKEPSWQEKSSAGIEAAGGMIAGSIASIPASIYGVGKDIYERTLGEGKSGVSEAGKYAEQAMQKTPGLPKTALGREYLGKVSEAFAVLPPVMPELAALGLISKQAQHGVKGFTGEIARKMEDTNAVKQATLDVMKSQRAPRDSVIIAGHEAGYTFTPSEAGTKFGKAMEGFSTMHIPFAENHHSAVDKIASLKNADITDSLGRKSLGLPEGAPLTKETFKNYRSEQAKSFQAVEAIKDPIKFSEDYLGSLKKLESNISKAEERFPNIVKTPEITKLTRELSRGKTITPEEAIQTMRFLREEATRNIKSEKEGSQRLGRVQKKAATAIENLIEESLNKPETKDLIPAFRQGRENTAKSYAIEESMVGDRLSAAELSKSDAPLTGELGLIKKMYQNHKSIMQDAANIKGKGLDRWMDYGLAAAALATGHPKLAMAAAARPSLRERITSQSYQAKHIGIPSYEAGGKTSPKIIRSAGEYAGLPKGTTSTISAARKSSGLTAYEIKEQERLKRKRDKEAQKREKE